MECKVHSPCGRFVASFTASPDGQSFALSVTSRREDCPIEYAATVTPPMIAQITQDAGVVKSATVFTTMVHSALIGSSSHVNFSVCTLAEATARLKAETPIEPVGEGMVSHEGLHSQLILLIEYSVPFTRAWYPIPLQQSNPHGRSPFHQQSLSRPLTSPTTTSQQQSSPDANARTVPRVLLLNDDEQNRTPYVKPGSSSPTEVTALQETIRQLRKENAALRTAGETALRDMQHDCERLKKELTKHNRLRAELVKCENSLTEAQKECRYWKDQCLQFKKQGQRSGGQGQGQVTGGRFSSPSPRTGSTTPSRVSPNRRVATAGRFTSPRSHRSDTEDERSNSSLQSNRSNRERRHGSGRLTPPRSPQQPALQASRDSPYRSSQRIWR
jgi:hypothetical protein